jgi:hypothetical protein
MLTFELRLGPLWLHFSMGDPTESTEPDDRYDMPAAQVEKADTVLTDPVPAGEPLERIGFRA